MEDWIIDNNLTLDWIVGGVLLIIVIAIIIISER